MNRVAMFVYLFISFAAGVSAGALVASELAVDAAKKGKLVTVDDHLDVVRLVEQVKWLEKRERQIQGDINDLQGKWLRTPKSVTSEEVREPERGAPVPPEPKEKRKTFIAEFINEKGEQVKLPSQVCPCSKNCKCGSVCECFAKSGLKDGAPCLPGKPGPGCNCGK